MITLGKTPFGAVHRSWALLAVGLALATLGMFACFVPGVLTEVARWTIGLALVAGGVALLLQLGLARDQAREWLKLGGVLTGITVACALAYALSIATGVIVLLPGVAPLAWQAAVLFVYGVSLFYAAFSLRRVTRAYPTAAPAPLVGAVWLADPGLSLELVHFLLMAVSLVLFGALLFPVGLGLLPYAPNGQFGLMLVLMAIQAMALGATPIGDVKPPALMASIGMAFAVIGVVASLLPGLPSEWLNGALGVLNIGGEVKLILSMRKRPGAGPGAGAAKRAAPPGLLASLRATVRALGALSIVFGLAVFAPTILPLFALATLLILMGALMFRLVFLLRARSALTPA